MSVRSPIVLNHWRAIFAEQCRSGLSITAFCRSRKIVKSSFHRWRNALEQLDQARAKPKPSPAFVPVRVVPEAVAVVEVILPSGIQLRVPLHADASQVSRLAHALGATSC
jgi:hypothetical protein